MRNTTVLTNSKKILIIDDELNVLRVLKSCLERKKCFHICLACDGEEALRKINENPPDLIILDLGLPKLPGIEVCKKIKMNERFKNIPIIVLTGKIEEVDKIICKVIGADFYMTKPFDLQELLKTVNKILGSGQ
jgi:DNA-binding response OmpR family regulator